MRRISSPALVQRLWEKKTATEDAPHDVYRSTMLPPPTTCTMKFFVVVLVLSGHDWEASRLLFDFYSVHPGMQTYEGGVAVLEHYMRANDDDEMDGRDSTNVLGKLRRGALTRLE